MDGRYWVDELYWDLTLGEDAEYTDNSANKMGQINYWIENPLSPE